MFSQPLARPISLTVRLALFVAAILFLPARAWTGPTYYIDNRGGSNCSDAGPGTNSAQPWCTFHPVNTIGNGVGFGSGTTILLARGATWNQQMDVSGSGTSRAWNTINAYGSGAKPAIIRNSGTNDVCINLNGGPSFWIVQNLECGHVRRGFLVSGYTGANNQGLHFANLYIHHVSDLSAGIKITAGGVRPYSAGQVILNDVEIRDTLMTDIKGKVFTLSAPYDVNIAHNAPQAIQNVVIRNNTFDTFWGGEFWGVSNAKLISNRWHKCDITAWKGGTTCLFLVKSDAITLANNEMTLTVNTGSSNQSFVDTEACVSRVRFYGNYFSQSAGAALEFLALRVNEFGNVHCNHNDFNTGHDASGNTFSGNATATNTQASLTFWREKVTPFDGRATDNLYSERTGFTYLGAGNSTGWTFTNNQSISSAANLFNAGNGFGSSQGANSWFYQSFNGFSYSNLTYDSSNQYWGTASTNISKFNQLPGSSSSTWIARAWTAPSAGTVSIRGRVLKNDVGGGDGVKARITKNGIVIWPTSGVPHAIAYNDNIGIETNLDSISVAANDVIRFEINDGGSGNAANDLTSWMPSIAYTSRKTAMFMILFVVLVVLSLLGWAAFHIASGRIHL